MLPVDARGEPLMNAVLYGVDTRASAQIAALNERIGEEAILEACGNALTSQSVGPKILWLKETHPDLYARTARVLTSTSYLVWKLTGEYVIDHYTAANFSPLYDVNRLDWTADLAPDIVPLERLPRLALVDRDRRPRHRRPPRPRRAWPRARPSPWAPSTPSPRRSASGSRPRAR